MDSPSEAASRAEQLPVMRALARVGMAAIGVLHVLVGAIAIAVAAGAGGDADQSGALQSIASVPGGRVAIGVLVIGLAALTVWQLLQIVVLRRKERRLADAAKAVVYAALTVLAGSVAVGSTRDASSSERTLSARLLALPGGVFVLALIGLAIVAVGVGFFVNGFTRRFERDMRLPPNALAGVTTVLGRIGYLAKGAALVLVGALVVTAAVAYDPEAAGGLDGSLKALARLPAGGLLLVAVALGLIAYGLFWLVRSVTVRL